jgi:hypothetical protein
VGSLHPSGRIKQLLGLVTLSLEELFAFVLRDFFPAFFSEVSHGISLSFLDFVFKEF